MRTTRRSQDFLGGDGAAEAIAPPNVGQIQPLCPCFSKFLIFCKREIRGPVEARKGSRTEVGVGRCGGHWEGRRRIAWRGDKQR